MDGRRCNITEAMAHMLTTTYEPGKITNKGNIHCRELADRHYTRQKPGSKSFTRPGYNYVLVCNDDNGFAAWVWWRPQWESGQERFDGLRAILVLNRQRRDGQGIPYLVSAIEKPVG